MVTVAELVEELQKLPQDLVVVLSKDEEGNGFKSLSSMTCEVAEDVEAYHIELLSDDEWNPNDANAVILWP